MDSPKSIEKILTIGIIFLAVGGAVTVFFMFNKLVSTEIFMAVILFIQSVISTLATLTLTILVLRVYEILEFMSGEKLKEIRKKKKK